jgi:molybdopterin/thiamine biosynthesis adenylyltransferase
VEKVVFNYKQAFSRNIGWLTALEQETLRGKRIAIAGLGGVGGAHLLTLTRLGIGAFHIADFDTFDLPNFNRQAGAMMSSVGRAKTEVLAEMARNINPELKLTVFEKGVNAENLDAFLDGVDFYVDGLDFFAFSARQLVFPGCEQRGIPATTAAPLGMGAAVLNFLPGGMTFEEYFRWDGCTEDEMALRFLVGLSPAMLQRGYLVDNSTVDFKARKGPSTPMACEICAGVVATQALKIMLKRGDVITVPCGLHFDAYSNKMVKTWRPGGNRNPIQRIALLIAGRHLAAMKQ